MPDQRIEFTDPIWRHVAVLAVNRTYIAEGTAIRPAYSAPDGYHSPERRTRVRVGFTKTAQGMIMGEVEAIDDMPPSARARDATTPTHVLRQIAERTRRELADTRASVARMECTAAPACLHCAAVHTADQLARDLERYELQIARVK